MKSLRQQRSLQQRSANIDRKQTEGNYGARAFYRGFRSYPGNQGSVCQKTPLKKFIIVDAGMNDLIRPSLYGAYHEIVPLSGNMRASEKADVVGPICESADFLAKGRVLPESERTNTWQ